MSFLLPEHGILVRTRAERYYGVITGPPDVDGEWFIFLANGLTIKLRFPDEFEVLPLKEGLQAPARFGEILDPKIHR